MTLHQLLFMIGSPGPHKQELGNFKIKLGS
jgi:hypothetical protein